MNVFEGSASLWYWSRSRKKVAAPNTTRSATPGMTKDKYLLWNYLKEMSR